MKCLSKQRRPVRVCTLIASYTATASISGHAGMLVAIDVDLATVGRKQRRELTAFVSQDDGRTWSKGLIIDERIGCTYPDAQQTTDGTIFLVWDYQRSSEQEILLTTFREEDVLTADNEAQARVLANRRLVSKGGVE